MPEPEAFVQLCDFVRAWSFGLFTRKDEQSSNAAVAIELATQARQMHARLREAERLILRMMAGRDASDGRHHCGACGASGADATFRHLADCAAWHFMLPTMAAWGERNGWRWGTKSYRWGNDWTEEWTVDSPDGRRWSDLGDFDADSGEGRAAVEAMLAAAVAAANA